MSDELACDDAVSRLRRNPESADAASVDAAVAVVESGTTRERRCAAVAVASVAEARPDLVAPTVTRLAGASDDEDPTVRTATTGALATVGASRREDLQSVVPTLVERAADSDSLVRRNALAALASVASHAPERVVSARGVALDALESAETYDDATRASAAIVLRYLSEAIPGSVAADVDRVLDALAAEVERPSAAETPLDGPALEDGEVERSRQTATIQHASTGTALASTVVVLANDAPRRLVDGAGKLGDLLARSDGGVRELLAEALAALGEESPAALAPVAEDLAAVLDDGRTRRHAALALAYLAAEETDRTAAAVGTHVDTLADALPAASTDERRAVVGLLAYVAEATPEALRPHRSVLVDRLDDEDPGVRGQALWSLRYIGVDTLDPLVALERGDPVPEIRTLAGDVRRRLDDRPREDGGCEGER